MNEPVENPPKVAESRLADAIREVKNAVADRDDVVVDIRESQRTRLELLAEDLQPVFADIPEDDDRFDFVISAGMQPRLWVDAVTHVTMARDRRTYRFLRDTRLGRVVLAESADMKAVADQVTRYIAERVLERRRVMEGDITSLGLETVVGSGGEAAPKRSRWASFLRAVGIILLGGLLGIALLGIFAWEQLAGSF